MVTSLEYLSRNEHLKEAASQPLDLCKQRLDLPGRGVKKRSK